MRNGSIAGATERAAVRRRAGQAGSLFGATMTTVAVGFVTSVLTTRFLGPETYGDMKFIGNVFQFLAVISTLGVFTTGAQLLARFRGTDEMRRAVRGGIFSITSILAGCMVLVSFIFALTEPLIFGNGLGPYFVAFSPLLVIAIMEPCVENILQGENRIHELSLFRVLPGLGYMALVVVASMIARLTLASVLLMQLAASVLVLGSFVYRLRPALSRTQGFRKMVWRSNRRYGWQVYLGVLAGVATNHLSTFMISYHLDNTRVGYFALATTLTLPLVQLSSVVGTTYFRDFAGTPFLPRRVTALTVGLALAALPAFILLVRPLVMIAYTEKFAGAASLAAIIAFGSVMHGLGDYFNRFLGAHRRGRDLRNGAIAVGAVNVVGYGLLVRYFGVEGAALTRVAAGGTYCGMMIWSYLRFRRESEVASRTMPRIEPVAPPPVERDDAQTGLTSPVLNRNIRIQEHGGML